MAEAVHENGTSNDATDTGEVETENLSTKLSNLPVLNDSLQTVSKKCQDIRETNSYVEYGMTVAESSLDKAMKAGKSVLDSSTLAPITNRAIGNIRYLDKEAGAMVDKLFGTKTEQETESEGLVKNGLVRGKDGVEERRPDQTSLASKDESMVSYLGRKLFEVTSFLIRFPKYAIVSILHLLQSTPENNRKRKERSSVCEEIQDLEPSPVKRKYGDRQTSSDDGSLIEMLHVREDYVSDEDPDYEPSEHESGEESGDELTASEKEEIGQEVEDLKLDLKEHGIKLDEKTSRKVEKSKKDLNECETENKDQSSSQQATKEGSSSAVKEKSLKPTEGKAEKESDKPKAESKTNAEKEPEKGEDIPLKEMSQKTKADSANKEDKFSSGKGIDPTSKTRKSSRSPLLEKLLSPGRRKSQKGKGKSENENLESGTSSEKAKSGIPVKSEKSENSEKTNSDSNVNAESNPSMSTVAGPFDMFKMGGKKAK